MWLGRQHIYFISDYAAAFPNVKVLLFFKNTDEQFSSTIENFHIKPKLPFPYASIFLYFIIISVSCCQYKKDRHNIYTEYIFLFQSTDAVPVLFLLERGCILPFIHSINLRFRNKTTPKYLEVSNQHL